MQAGRTAYRPRDLVQHDPFVAGGAGLGVVEAIAWYNVVVTVVIGVHKAFAASHLQASRIRQHS